MVLCWQHNKVYLPTAEIHLSPKSALRSNGSLSNAYGKDSTDITLAKVADFANLFSEHIIWSTVPDVDQIVQVCVNDSDDECCRVSVPGHAWVGISKPSDLHGDTFELATTTEQMLALGWHASSDNGIMIDRTRVRGETFDNADGYSGNSFVRQERQSIQLLVTRDMQLDTKYVSNVGDELGTWVSVYPFRRGEQIFLSNWISLQHLISECPHSVNNQF
jgi:hypothetical protein